MGGWGHTKASEVDVCFILTAALISAIIKY